MNEPLNPEVHRSLNDRYELEMSKLYLDGVTGGDQVRRTAVQRTRNWAVAQGYSIGQIDGWTDLTYPNYRQAGKTLDMPAYGEELFREPAPEGLDEESLEFAGMIVDADVEVKFGSFEFDSWRRLAESANMELSRLCGWKGDRPMVFDGIDGTYFRISPDRIEFVMNREVCGTVTPDREEGVHLSGFRGVAAGHEKESTVALVLHNNNVATMSDITKGFENYHVFEYGSRRIVAADHMDDDMRSAFLEAMGSAEFLGTQDAAKVCSAYMNRFLKEGPQAGPVMRSKTWSYSGKGVVPASEVWLSTPGREFAQKRLQSLEELRSVAASVRDELNGAVGAELGRRFNYRGAVSPREKFSGSVELGTLKGSAYAIFGEYSVSPRGRVNYYEPDDRGALVCTKSFQSAAEAKEHMRGVVLEEGNVEAAKVSFNHWKNEKKEKGEDRGQDRSGGISRKI